MPDHFAAIVVAAGRGVRAGGGIPKQYRPLGGIPVLARCLNRFLSHPMTAEIVLVVRPEDEPLFEERVRPHLKAGAAAGPALRFVPGGDSREASVREGLSHVTQRQVLIHDGARPLLSDALIDRLLEALDHAEGAAPALPLTDALWRSESGRVDHAVPRHGLFRAQTPQAFRTDAIRQAHARFSKGGSTAADDVEVARAHGIDVQVVAGEEKNLKLTTAADFTRAESYLRGSPLDVRTGNGFDVHRFGPGDHVMLCGVRIAYPRGLVGHSDADVGMHAVTDAIYGALGAGDIGRHFPPSDPQWKGAASQVFLRHAAEMARRAGFRLANADCTLICEQPKIGPHVAAMKSKMAGYLGADPERISVKATTSEKLGFTGREEGIAAMATVTLIRETGA